MGAAVSNEMFGFGNLIGQVSRMKAAVIAMQGRIYGNCDNQPGDGRSGENI
jgi:hypothetical protein